MTKTYIAGPMTGLPELNFPAFHQAAEWLRGMGHEVVNPAEINPGVSMEWHECMRADIAQLVTCQCIYLLPGWEDSRGAKLEHHIAERLGMRIEFVPAPVSEFQRLRGEAGVLRALLRECADVIFTIKGDDSDESEKLCKLHQACLAAIAGIPA
jgi:Domain of unknown function (DUF4406)